AWRGLVEADAHGSLPGDRGPPKHLAQGYENSAGPHLDRRAALGGGQMTTIGTTIQPSHGSYLTPRYEKALVSDAMRIGVFTCPPETSLRDVAQMMATHHIHCVVVTDIAGRGKGRRSWGILSALDLVRAAGPDAAERTASETAATELV